MREVHGYGVSSKIRLFEKIRRDHRRDELSVRALAEKYEVHRRTVREALSSAVPKARAPRTVPAPKLDRVKPLVDAMLVTDLDAPRNQRHTARRIFNRLVDEHGVAELSYSTVRDYVKVRRPEIKVEAGRSIAEGYVSCSRCGARSAQRPWLFGARFKQDHP